MSTVWQVPANVDIQSQYPAFQAHHTAQPERKIARLAIAWVLVLPLVFFGVGGIFSFEGAAADDAGHSALAGIASTGHQLGLLGYVVIPGIAYGIAVWLIIKNAQKIIRMAERMKLLTLLALLTIVSALWSQVPLRSAYNGGFYLVSTLFAFYLVSKFETADILKILVLAGTVLVTTSLLVVVFAPKYGLTYTARDYGAWQGLFGNRTMAAKCLVFLLSPAIIFRRSSLRLKNLLYIAVMLIFIFMTAAQTARAILVCYVPLMAALRLFSRLERRSAFLVAGTSVLAVLTSFGLFVSVVPALLGSLGRDATLSGRTLIWAALMQSIARRPLLGYGFYAFWLGLVGESGRVIVALGWAFGYAHNGFIEICLQLGLVGLAIFLATLLQAIKNAWFCLRRSCPPQVHWYVGVIFLTIFYNTDEATVLWPNDLLSILYVVACCGLAQAASQIRSQILSESTDITHAADLSLA